ncbi:hypothetical protein ACFQY4_14900 [Catellatospora bangladeshensis]|uniref:hypothetical protein n=1 Tax=Catellatospora bangladeshensis TaxID=310355 RepID=UPI00360D1658
MPSPAAAGIAVIAPPPLPQAVSASANAKVAAAASAVSFLLPYMAVVPFSGGIFTTDSAPVPPWMGGVGTIFSDFWVSDDTSAARRVIRRAALRSCVVIG